MTRSIRDVWQQANSLIRSARQIVNAGLKPLDLTSPDGNILLHLFLQKDAAMNQEHLVDQLDIGKAAVSRALDSLEEKGYVVRQRRSDDKRAYQLLLTEKALSVGQKIEQVYDNIYTIASQDIEPEELERLVQLLGRISENFMAEL